jgi:virginiamycin A acetyltransferase
MREFLKTSARGLARLVMLPAVLSFEVRARVMGRDRALAGSTQALAILPGLLGQYLRRAFLAHALEGGCDATATIEFGTIFSQAGARIDARVYVGPRCHLGLVHLERDVLIAAGVHVPSGAATHGTEDVDRPIRDQDGSPSLVRIGEGAWIGSAAIVLADVGRHSIGGAGAVVTRPVPEYTVAAGVPAKVVRARRPANEVAGA